MLKENSNERGNGWTDVMNYVIMLVIYYLSMFVYLSYHILC